MKKMTVIKGVMLFLIAVFLVMFVIENFDPVPLYIPFLKGRNVGMMYIVLAAYLLGFATAFIAMRNIGAGDRKKRGVDQDDGSEELYDEE